jgi:hypothetical protein
MPCLAMPSLTVPCPTVPRLTMATVPQPWALGTGLYIVDGNATAPPTPL